ncbi:hypothetical protein [uncultured Megasphaera sp.]|uniref:hypothetical protein n=1 Tax=uncultured Megasphaera sp. TaxID=165188 RepID=UPI00343EF981
MAFAKKVRTIGFDINKAKLVAYQRGIDPTKETGDEAVKETTLHFTPGLVGGHCIGVDPYYFIYEARRSGYFQGLPDCPGLIEI